MKPRTASDFSCAILLVAFAALAIHCDRQIEPFDPSEEPAPPDLARIYPAAAEPAARPAGGGMPSPWAGARQDASPPAAQPVRPDSGATLSGIVEIDDALYAGRPVGGMLFIIARFQASGPPLAVLAVPTPSFPHTFEIGQAQVMIPTLRFAGEIQLSARLDSDGDAMTKLSGDLVGEITNPLVPGSSGVVLVLDRKL